MLDSADLLSEHVAASAAADVLYERKTVQASDPAAAKMSRKAKTTLGEEINVAWKRIISANERASSDLCSDVLKKLERERQEEERQRRKGGSGSSSMASSNAAGGGFEGQLAELRRLQAERDAVRAKLAKSTGSKTGKETESGGKKVGLDIGKTLQQFKEDVDKIVVRYMDEAAGPSKDQVLRDYLLSTVMPTVVSTGVEGARQQSMKIKELREQTMSKSNEVAAALTKTTELRKQMSEKMSALKAGQIEQMTKADNEMRDKVAMYEAKLSEAKSKETHALEIQETIKSTVTKLEEELNTARESISGSTTEEKKWRELERKWHGEERKLRDDASKAIFELEALQRERSAGSEVVEREGALFSLYLFFFDLLSPFLSLLVSDPLFFLFFDVLTFFLLALPDLLLLLPLFLLFFCSTTSSSGAQGSSQERG